MIRRFYHIDSPDYISEYDEDGIGWELDKLTYGNKIKITDKWPSTLWSNLEGILILQKMYPDEIFEILPKNPEKEFVLTAEDFYL